MAINPNNGVLDIINGTLKVSSIDIKQAGGFTTAINTVARNDVLLFDDQKATTTFTPIQNVGYSSSTGVTRDTTAGAGYIDFNDGWVYWPLQLPNSWHAEFDTLLTTTGGVLTFSLFNTSTPNHTDYTANDGGYKIVFDNTQNQIDVYWEGSIHKSVSASLRSNDWQHININYFLGAISISLAGKVVLTHEFTENYQEFDSRYVGFSATSGASHKIRHLRVHNSDKWLYTKTSNASDIAYVSGNVGIGSLSPTELLDVHGNVHIAKDLTVDGNLTVSGTTTFIDTANMSVEDPIIELARGNASDTIDSGLVITRATSNVAVAYRGDEAELALGYTQSGASEADVVPVADGGLDVRVYGNLFANNLTTTANVEATYLKGDGSELTGITLESVVDYGNTSSNTVQLTNSNVGLIATGNVEAAYFIGDGSKLTGLVTTLESVTDNGNTTSNTVQFTNSTTSLIASSNVGIGTSVPDADLHVVGYQYVNDPPTQSASFDHSDAPLTLTHPTPTSTTAIDDPKAVLHLTRDGTQGTNYGAKASLKMSRYENSGTASRSRLDVTLADGTYTESNVMSMRADGRVGIGTTAPGYTLDVAGDINLSGDFYQGGSPFVSSLWTAGTDSLYYRSNVEMGTGNLFVDTTQGYVGIGTTTPTVELDVVGNVHVSNNISGNSLTLNNVSVTTTMGLDEVLNVGNTSSNTIQITNTTESVSNTTGAIVVSGGLGVGSNLFVGKDLTVSGAMTINTVALSTTTNLQEVTNDGNTTTNTVEFNNPTTSLVAAGNVEVGTANLFVDTTTGRVGVGTGSPSKNLQVYGTSYPSIVVGGPNSDIRLVTDTAAPYDQVIRGTSNVVIEAPANSKRLFINGTNGNVGIGTNSPLQQLHVRGNGENPVIYMSDPSNNRYSSGMGSHHVGGVGQRLDFYNGDSGANGTSLSSSHIRMSIDTNGNVGIGTVSPGAKLHVNGTTLGVPGVYAKGSWTSGTGVELGYINTTAYKYHRIVARFYATAPSFQRCNVRIRSREVGQSAFNTSGYESWGSIIKKTTPGSLDYIYTGADGPLVAYFNDTQATNNSDVLLIMDISNVLNGRAQLQFECSYTYGNVGYTRAFGGFHRSSSASIDKIKLYFEQYGTGNTATGSVGDYMIIGYG